MRLPGTVGEGDPTLPVPPVRETQEVGGKNAEAVLTSSSVAGSRRLAMRAARPLTMQGLEGFGWTADSLWLPVVARFMRVSVALLRPCTKRHPEMVFVPSPRRKGTSCETREKKKPAYSLGASICGDRFEISPQRCLSQHYRSLS